MGGAKVAASGHRRDRRGQVQKGGGEEEEEAIHGGRSGPEETDDRRTLGRRRRRPARPVPAPRVLPPGPSSRPPSSVVSSVAEGIGALKVEDDVDFRSG